MNRKTRNILSFRVGGEWYGVPVEAVIEVLQMIALTELPGEDVVGVMTLRDTVMPVVDLRQRFGLPQAELKLDTSIIAVQTPRGGVGLVVDEADDVEHIPLENIIPYEGVYVKQVARREGGGLLLLLDIALLDHVGHPERQL